MTGNRWYKQIFSFAWCKYEDKHRGKKFLSRLANQKLRTLGKKEVKKIKEDES